MRLLKESSLSDKKKVAIVGMACRFPGEANSPEAYWDVLKNAKDLVTEVSSERWGTDFYQHPDKKEAGKSYTFAAGVLPHVDEFDASFFGISPREAAQMDPQQRLLLELTWEALENGQQVPETLAGSQCAVYIGIASTDYAHRRMDDLSSLDPYSMTGNTASIASNRISYVYDLHGPSVSVDTACSSSLVALHQACNAIWNGDAPFAITGGVNMLLHPFGFVGFSKASMLSPRGRCRAFDATGDGYVRSEGSAVLFLKPLEDAERDGDPIHAVIVNTGINCDGRTNGITLPSTEGQSALLTRVYEGAGVDPEDITYLEAHGTGTAIGDPLEAAALAKALGKKRKKALPIGSAKTNLGHLETASGMAGLLKVILSLKNKAIPASLHFNEPNPNIDFAGDKLSVVTSFTPLEASEKPLLMGVNSFGFGGANAHVIVEEYQPKSQSKDQKKQANKLGRKPSKKQLKKSASKNHPPLFLSANNTQALRDMAGQYRDLLQQDGVNYDDVAWSAYSKRQQFSAGLAVHADKHHSIAECLHAFSQGELHTGATTTNKVEAVVDNDIDGVAKPKLALVFSGNGSQWQGMGCELLASEPLFLETVTEIDALLKSYSKSDDEISLLDEFKAAEDKSRLALTEVAQPLLFALQVGIMRVLESKGLIADAVTGHSVGEVAAAWAAGILSLKDAVRVIYQRSHAQGKTAGAGRMAAASMSEEETRLLLEDLGLLSDITIAGVNSPKAVTLSGSLEALETLNEYFDEQGVFYRILDLDYAFHSAAMDPVENDIKQSLQNLDLLDSQRGFYSTVSGGLLAGDKLDANYWWDNIRKPVMFASAMDALLEDGYQVFLEVGPHSVLRSYINDCGRDKSFSILAVQTLRRKQESKTALINSLYNCHLAGCPLDDEKVFGVTTNLQSITLPHYPWQREKHWYTLTPEGKDLVNRSRAHPLLGYRLNDQEAMWENQIDTQILPFLGDHVVDGGAIMPAAAYVEMALAASADWFASDDTSTKADGNSASNSGDNAEYKQWELENLEIRAPIVLDCNKTIRLTLHPKDGSFTISSRDRLSDNPWSENVVGRLLGETHKKAPKKVAIKPFISNAEKIISAAGHYRLTESVGLSYGVTFQGVEEVWVSSLSALAKLTIPAELKEDFSKYQLHPAMLDAGFQVLVDIFADDIEQGSQAALIPVQVGKLYQFADIKDLAYLSVNIKKQSPQSVVADYLLMDAFGTVLAELTDCRFKGVQLTRSASTLPTSYEFKPLLMPELEAGKQSPVSEPVSLVAHALDFLRINEPNLQRKKHYQEVLPLFDVMVSMFAWQAIRQLNPKGDEFTLESLAEQAHIESTKHPLLSRLLNILVEDDLATYENGQWLLAIESDMPSAENIWLSVLGDSPSYLPELMFLGRCGKHMTDVLQHKTQPETLLYSSKSSIQEHWNGASPSNLSINLALRESLSEIVADWPANRRLRILEVGANDTEITQLLLSVLPEDQCDYDYIHHDDELLAKAGFDLERYAFVKTHLLDLSHTIETDSCSVHLATYDIVIAANTLHHSDDLLKAQKNIKQLLAPKGVLLLVERQSDRFMDMTFGLQTDWWIHTSETKNPVPLLMSANEWRNSLKEVGFDQIELLIDPEAAGDAGAFMVVANHTDALVQADTADLSDVESETWMILKDDSKVSNGLSHTLEQSLKKDGHQVIIVEPAATYKRLGPKHFAINLDFDSALSKQSEEHFEHVLDTLDKLDIHCDHIVHLMGLEWHDAPLAASMASNDNVLSLQNKRCASTVDLVKALASRQLSAQLHLVTSGGAVVAKEDQDFDFAINPAQSALWGLGRVVMNEHPDLNCAMIDLQGTFNANDTGRLLFKELLSNAGEASEKHQENEVIISDTARHVMRMTPVTLRASASNNQNSTENKPYALRFSTPGQLKNLIWQELPEQFLKADEIEIKPAAAGLNFRDVMYAMGLLSDEAVENGFAGPTLGMELSGTVIKVGSAVTEFKAGDEVVGFAPACFSSRVITQTTAISHKPQGWSFEEATTIPTTFFTVYYALKHLGQIQPGEKILIHGAAGGVGIAAIQFARFCGAEIFATAGSDEKRDFVRLMGADHVMDSRSLAFADDIMDITNGEGVDIVLNSLAGEAITRNLSVLKPFGRFLELGKRDFYENSKIGLRPFRNNISYFGIDADQLLIERPELANRLFKEMMTHFDEGSLRPMPYRSFPATRVADAFRYMQQSRQIGKVVVSFGSSQSMGDGIPADLIQPLPQTDEAYVCDENGSYLVTGGLSGFGLKTACWLVDKGARSLVLISRSAKVDDESAIIIKNLQDKGVQVFSRACDVTDKSALRHLVSEVESDIAPLAGIVHAAMVLDDGLIRNMSQAQLHKVMSPKITGAWNLHEVSLDLDLSLFVLYSSATTFVGNPGQANYVAANSFLESLVTYRKAQGLPAHYAAWGAISDVGYLARNEETKEALQSRLGGHALASDQALRTLEKIMLSDKAGAAVIDLDWSVIQRVMPAANSAKYEILQRQVKSSDSDHEDIQVLIANMSKDEVQDLVVDLLLDEIEQILRLPREKLDIEQSVFDLGMDSLMGMELVLAIEERFGVKLPVMALTEGANIQRIAERITAQLSSSDSGSNAGSDTDSASSEQKEKHAHQDDISIAAARHGHGKDGKMTQDEAEALSKKLIEDAMKPSS